MGGVRFIYAPERRLIARCNAPECGCIWLNVGVGCVRIWPLRNTCWGWWHSRRFAGYLLRGASNTEKPERFVNIPS